MHVNLRLDRCRRATNKTQSLYGIVFLAKWLNTRMYMHNTWHF